jgi:hypothetical protein
MSCQNWKRRLAYDDQQHDVVAYDRGKFIGLVADAVVVSDGDPLFFAYGFQPDFIRTIRWKVVTVPAYIQTCGNR